MTFGAKSIGARGVGNTVSVADMRPTSAPVNVLDHRAQDFVQPAEWLEFYDIATTTDGVKRFVNFADADAGGATPDVVPFNGQNYAARTIGRGAIDATADALPTFAVSIEDPDRALLATLRAERAANRWGWMGQQLTLRRIPYDQVATPSMSQIYTFEILSALPKSNPATVELQVGVPNFRDLRVPRGLYSRVLCPLRYDRRFQIDNLCRYPSDDFEQGTAQQLGGTIFGFAPAVATKRGYGWWSLNADMTTTWDIGIDNETVVVSSGDTTPRTVTQNYRCRMYSTGNGGSSAWNDAAQDGPYQYKLISGDFDVYTKVALYNMTGANDGWFCGILLQDASDTGDWVAYGRAAHITSGDDIRRVRTTVANVSTDDDQNLTGPPPLAIPAYLRMKRVGDTIKVYSSSTGLDSWTEHTAQETSLTGLGDLVRIGLFASNDDSANLCSARFSYLHFLSGGLSSCGLDYEDCVAHENEHQFSAHPAIRRSN